MPLPEKDFRWLTEEECLSLDILHADLDSDIGYLLEVDLHYPEHLHDSTSDLPFAPEKSKLSQQNFTQFQSDQYKQAYGDMRYPGYEKLLLTVWDKENYIVHARLLQFYLQQGMVLRKIHGGIKFTQSSFLKPYISFNSRMRQEATNNFEKDYYKLKNNSLYGKMVENVRRRMNFRLCNTPEQVEKLSSAPRFQSSIIFNENLVGVHLAKEMIVLDKPVFIGQAVLDLSKLVMYELRYVHLARYVSFYLYVCMCE